MFILFLLLFGRIRDANQEFAALFQHVREQDPEAWRINGANHPAQRGERIRMPHENQFTGDAHGVEHEKERVARPDQPRRRLLHQRRGVECVADHFGRALVATVAVSKMRARRAPRQPGGSSRRGGTAWWHRRRAAATQSAWPSSAPGSAPIPAAHAQSKHSL
jgi:hypothetical protein